MTAKQQAIRALNQLARSIQCIERPAFQAKHKDYLATELQAFSLAHGIKLLPIGYKDRGEGVSIPPASENSNQLPLPSKNPQCDNGIGNRVRYITGITTLYSDGSAIHEARGRPVGCSKAVEASISSGEGQESSRVEIEAPGAKEGTLEMAEKARRLAQNLSREDKERMMAHGLQLINRQGGETPEEFTARQHQEGGSSQLSPVSEKDAAPSSQLDKTSLSTIWPKEARVSILGPTLNPRLCSGALIEEGWRMGRKVSVWKGRFFYKSGSILKCKLDLVQGDDARYLPV